MQNNLVVNVKDLVNWLEENKKYTESQLSTVLSNDDLKNKLLEVAKDGSKASSLLTFKDLLDNIKKEAFIHGQVSVYTSMLDTLNKQA